MGYIKHNAIIITLYDGDKYNQVIEEAKSVFGEEMVSDSVTSIMNGFKSFFIGPDGSKEGWDHSDDGDENRAKFIEWCKGKSVDYVEVSYGGDEPKLSHIVNHN